MRKIIALFTLIIPVFLYSQTYQNHTTNLTITHNSYEKLSLINTLSIKDINALKVKTSKGFFSELIIKGYGSSNIIGEPKLPVYKHLIEIPYSAHVKINILNSTYIDIPLEDLGAKHTVIPVQPSISKSQDPATIEFKINKSLYQTNDFCPHELVSVSNKGNMRGINIGLLEIAPIYYNPVRQILRIYTTVETEILFENADIALTMENKQKYYSPYFEPSYGKLLNYKNLNTKSNLTTYPVKYVIVSDPTFQTSLQPFVAWKTKKGFTVVEAYTNDPLVGNTTTSIKSYLQNLYNSASPSDPAPSFVLFVGDVSQIPAFSGTQGSHVTDLYYCEYTGDFLPEVYYGRFSATNTSELIPQIEKTLEYEQYLMPKKTFLDTCVMIAGQDATYGPTYGDGQINYGTETYFNATHGLYSHTYPYAISGSSASQIIQNVSKGACVVNYTAHGGPTGWSNPAFTNNDVATLTNTGKYPLMIGNCCLTNKFDDPVCFGEALLRANGKGALGYIGGSNNTYWDEDFFWAVGYRSYPTSNPPLHPTYDATKLGAYDRTFHSHGEAFGDWFVTQGQMVAAGNLAVTQSGNSSFSYYWEVYHLMGDPSLMVYYSKPTPIIPSYSPLMPLGVTTFNINTNTPYSYAAISKDGVLHGAALADSLGNVTINLNPITVPGTADIVITCQNKEPFIGTVQVDSPVGPYVLLLKNKVGNTTNGDTLVDFNETVSLDITLKNYGQTEATNITATLSSSDPYINITDNTHSWGNIPSSASSLQTNAFAFTTNSYVPDQHLAPFTITIQDNNNNTWNSTFSIRIQAPELNIGNFTVNDAAGNNNGAIDPGENVSIIIGSSNTGHSNAPQTTGTLTCTNPYITIANNVYQFNTLEKGTSQDAVFDVQVSPALPDSSILEFVYTVQSGSYQATNYYYITVGRAIEDFETGDFTKFEWQNGGSAPWIITNVGPYEGNYSAKSGNIGHNQTSELFITLNVSQPDTISFVKKVSCEKGSNWGGYYFWYDYLEFLIDGISKERWDGIELNWSKVAYPVNQGIHTFKWIYKKDGSTVEGEDCAWIDYIIFPPTIKIVNQTENLLDVTPQLAFYPNPSKGFSFIEFTLSANSNVQLCVYQANGKLIDIILNNAQKSSGLHRILLNTAKYPAGEYLLVLNVNNHKIIKKITIIK